MRIRAGYRITYEAPGATPMLLMLNVRPERAADLETPDTVRTDPAVPVRTYIDLFGNVCSRLTAPAGRTTLWSDFVIEDRGRPDPTPMQAVQHPIDELPDHLTDEIEHFFDVYKMLEPGKHTNTKGYEGVDAAWVEIAAAFERFGTGD